MEKSDLFYVIYCHGDFRERCLLKLKSKHIKHRSANKKHKILSNYIFVSQENDLKLLKSIETDQEYYFLMQIGTNNLATLDRDVVKELISYSYKTETELQIFDNKLVKIIKGQHKEKYGKCINVSKTKNTIDMVTYMFSGSKICLKSIPAKNVEVVKVAI